MKTIVTLILFISVSLNTYGDSSSYIEGKGGTLIPLSMTDVSMEEESIDIKVDKISDGVYRLGFDCEFYFKSNVKETISLLMGFPIQYGYTEDSSGSKVIGENEVTAFQVIIDGAFINYEKYLHGFNPDLKDIEGYDEVCAFDVIFKPEESKKVLIRFATITTYHTMMNSYLPIKYILKSAQTWKLPIKKAVMSISFGFPVIVPDYVPRDKPDKIKITTIPNTKIELAYYNYSPKNDLVLIMREKKLFPENSYELLGQSGWRDNKIDVNNKDLYFDYAFFYTHVIKDMPAESRARLRWAIVASHGYIGEGEIKAYLENTFYKNNRFSPDPDFRFEMLTDEERILFDALGQKKVPASFDYNYDGRLKKLVDEYQKQGNAAIIENMIYFFKKCQLNDMENRIDGSLMKKAKGIVKAFLESRLNGDNIVELGSIIWTAENLPKPILESIDATLIEKAKAREQELEKRAYSDKKILMERISRLLEENRGDSVFIRNAFVLASYCSSLHHSDIYQKNDEDFIQTCENSVTGYYESLFTNATGMDFILYPSFRNLEIQISSYIYEQNGKTLFSFYVPVFKKQMEHLLATKKIDDAEKLLSILDYAGKPSNPKNIDELDIVRKAYYTVGNTFHIKKEYLKAIGAYTEAILYARSNTQRLNTSIQFYLNDISAWEREGETEAPCYYIAYNMACSYSKLSKFNESHDWLDVALRLNRKLSEIARKDPDLEELRVGAWHEEFERLIKEK